MSSLKAQYGKIANIGRSLANIVCTDDGIPTGNSNILSDFSITPDEFYIVAPANTCLTITQLNLSVGDSGSIGINDYGSVSALTNGMLFFVDRGAGNEILSVSPIKTNYDLANISSMTDMLILSGSERILTYRELGSDIIEGIELLPGDRFGVIVNDNFTGLLANRVLVKTAARAIGV